MNILKNMDKISLKEIKKNAEKVLKDNLNEINNRFKNNYYLIYDNKKNYRIEFNKIVMKSDKTILWHITLSKLEKDRILEDDEITIKTFLENPKGLVKLAIDGFKEKEKKMKNFKGFETLLKKALRECNKDNTYVKFPYFSNGITYKDGKYYFNKVIDNGLTKLTMGKVLRRNLIL